jgi:hypothetical protein
MQKSQKGRNIRPPLGKDFMRKYCIFCLEMGVLTHFLGALFEIIGLMDI